MPIHSRFVLCSLLILPVACDLEAPEPDDESFTFRGRSDDDDDGGGCGNIATVGTTLAFVKKGHFFELADYEGLPYSEHPAEWRMAFDQDVALQTEAIALRNFDTDPALQDACASACAEAAFEQSTSPCVFDLTVAHGDATGQPGYGSPRWSVDVEAMVEFGCGCS